MSGSNGRESPTTGRLPDGTRWVDTAVGLEELVAAVKRVRDHSPSFRSCLDTEADSLHHYQEKLCLIQLAYGDEFALVDPLAVTDMQPLIDVLDEGEVWFHGADYDLTLLRRTYGWTPKVVRDTQIAARLAGSRQFGLAALIEQHFGKHISKASQKADWSRRPLPANMLTYAVEDVRYLLTLADILQTQLCEKGRQAWFEQSCESLRADVLTRSTEPREDRWRVQGSGKLHPRGLAFLERLWQWRDKIAEERDVPCFRIISNRQMMEAAIQFEKGGPAPAPPAGWRPKWKQDFHEILQAVDRCEPSTWPVRLRLNGHRMTEAARAQLDALCQHREVVAQKLDLEPSLIGARGTLESVVNSPDGILELLPWQQEVLAEPLAKAQEILGFAAK